MKTKFTTNIDKELLEELKIKAIKENKNVNEILEDLIGNYLGVKKMYELQIELNGEYEVLGTFETKEELVEQYERYKEEDEQEETYYCSEKANGNVKDFYQL